jgi:hypothetical protein
MSTPPRCVHEQGNQYGVYADRKAGSVSIVIHLIEMDRSANIEYEWVKNNREAGGYSARARPGQ